METNDKLLKDFFSENKKEIADDGFSNRVIRKLPEAEYRGWIVWVFAAIGLSLTMALGIYTGLFENLYKSILLTNIYYLLGAVFVFPLLGTFFFLFNKNRHYSLV